MVEADIHLKPLHTSILDMYKVFEHWYAASGSLEECKNCHNVMVEADSAMWCHNAVKTDASCARSTQK